MYVLKRRPLKRNDHNSCSLSFIWYYLSSCQDCGVFRIWKDLVKQGEVAGIKQYIRSPSPTPTRRGRSPGDVIFAGDRPRRVGLGDRMYFLIDQSIRQFHNVNAIKKTCQKHAQTRQKYTTYLYL